MRRATLWLCGATLLSAVAPALCATASAEERQFGYSVTLMGTSDYMFRGLSYNNEDPAFQAYIEATYGIGYVAVGGSGIADPYGPYELDLYAGIRPVTGPISWDIGVMYYMYPGGDDPDDYDYAEFKIAASTTPVENVTLGIAGYATPDQGIAYPDTVTVEGNVAYTLPTIGKISPTLSGLLGYTTASEPTAFFYGEEDYVYWNAGIKFTVEKLFMDFRYWDTNIGTTAYNGGDTGLVDSRFVFTAGVTLP